MVHNKTVAWEHNGKTVLIAECDCVWEKKLGGVEFLLEKAARLNIQDKYRNTALMCAVFRKRHEMVKLILGEDGIAKFAR